MSNDETFVHDGWQIVMALQNGEVKNRYLWGAKQDELLACDDEWMLGDHLNTVRDVVKSDGSVVKHLEYNAFGELQGESVDEELAFRYTGKMFDSATGLQWNINRWYDPSVGRWISEDPIGFEGGDANLSRYVGNEVVARFDMLGLAWCEDECKTGTRTNVDQISFTFKKPYSLGPKATEAGLAAANNAINLAFVAGATQAGISYATASIAAATADGMAFLTDQIATGGLGDAIRNSGGGIEQMIMDNQGFEIWSKVKYQECESTNCYCFWTNNEFVDQEPVWYKCNLAGFTTQNGFGNGVLRNPSDQELALAIIKCMIESINAIKENNN